MSIDDLIAIVQWDPLAHAWDIAKAAGLNPVADDELADSSLKTISTMADMLREWKLIGTPIDVPTHATATERFLAVTGRNPAR